MKLQILKKSQKQEIIKKLDESFGIKNLNYLFMQTSYDKIRGYSGSLSRDELNILMKNIHIEAIGMYLATLVGNKIRLSFDSCTLLKQKINKNIIKITNKQAELWLRGQDLNLDKDENTNTHNGEFVIIQNKQDFLGIGKITQDKRILNYVPKERRRKN